MNRILLFVLLLAGPLQTSAQETTFLKPDLELIRKQTGDTASAYYFPILLDKFRRADSGMTLEEKRHLYYGSAYQPEDKAGDNNHFRDSLRAVLGKDTLSVTDYDRIIYYTTRLLKHSPFDIRLRQYQTVAYRRTGQTAEAAANKVRTGIISDAIMSTGNGVSKENAIYVVAVGNEYDMIYLLGLRYGGKQQLVDMRYDYLTLEENKYHLSGLYFDTSISLDKLRSLLRDDDEPVKQCRKK